MKRYSLGERMRYAFDNTMSRGTWALIAWLGLVSVLLIFSVSAFVLWVAPKPVPPFAHLLWMSLLRTLDPGTMGADEGSPLFLASMLTITFGGIFVISTLIGVLTSGIEHKIEELRKGRSQVVETGHTVILGWSEQIFPILSELALSTKGRHRVCVAILAWKDKVHMEDEIAAKVGRPAGLRIVCRHGSPIDTQDLDLVSIQTCGAIIVLSPPIADPDPEVVKTVLAITNHPGRRPEPYHIVAELRSGASTEVARMVGRDEVELVVVSEIMARVVAQTCRQPGLSVVYADLLDFGGDAIVFREELALRGRTFGEALLSYESATVIGLKSRGLPARLNPPMDTRLAEGDELVIVAASADAAALGLAPNGLEVAVDQSALVSGEPSAPSPERILLLGWNWSGSDVINELDHYVAAGSTVTVVAGSERPAREIARRCDRLKNLKVAVEQRDTTDRRSLDEVDVPSFEHVVLLSDSDTLDAAGADARTLFTLLHLRDIAEKSGRQFSIVTEMLDVRNRELAEITRADDFVVSNRLMSHMLTQVARTKALNAVFTDMFDPVGSEIYLKPAESYVTLGRTASFATVVAAARARGEIAIGYRVRAQALLHTRSSGVVVNPKKSEKISFAEGDQIIVVAEQ